LITLSGSGSFAAESPDPALTKQITAILAECATLSHGGTRADLLKDFNNDGGLSSPEEGRFVSKRCPYIKIDVEFTVSNPKPASKSSTDTIKTISKPYLEPPYFD